MHQKPHSPFNPDAGDAPFKCTAADSGSNLIFICEHASNFIPDAYENLGLRKIDLNKHIGWDIGTEELTRMLAVRLNAPSITACFSRLLIDPNRATDQFGLIPEQSDHIIIPANQNISATEKKKRIDDYYQPFHDATSELIQGALKRSITPLLINIHSFTPEMNGHQRPWKVGLLWNEDERLKNLLMPQLTAAGYNVGDNEPYSGKELYFTLDHHAKPRSLPHVMIEIRQDQINHPEGIKKWCDILEPMIQKISQTFKDDT